MFSCFLSKFSFFRYNFVNWHAHSGSFRLLIETTGFSGLHFFVSFFVLFESKEVRGEFFCSDEIFWKSLVVKTLSNKVPECFS